MFCIYGTSVCMIYFKSVGPSLLSQPGSANDKPNLSVFFFFQHEPAQRVHQRPAGQLEDDSGSIFYCFFLRSSLFDDGEVYCRVYGVAVYFCVLCSCCSFSWTLLSEVSGSAKLINHSRKQLHEWKLKYLNISRVVLFLHCLIGDISNRTHLFLQQNKTGDCSG